MRYILIVLNFLFYGNVLSQSAFTQEYGQLTVLSEAQVYPLTHELPAFVPLDLVRATKMPMDGKFSSFFISSVVPLPNFSVELVSRDGDGNIVPLLTLFESVEFNSSDFFDIRLDPGVEFKKGDFMGLLFTRLEPSVTGREDFYFSYTINWNKGMNTEKIPTLGSWSVFILALILLSVGAVAGRNSERQANQSIENSDIAHV